MEWCVVEADVGFLSDGLLTPRSPGTRSMVAGKDDLDQRIENRVSGEHGGPRWVGQLNYDCERSEWYHVDAHDKGKYEERGLMCTRRRRPGGPQTPGRLWDYINMYPGKLEPQ